ncbi:MAG: NUDIX hydrolase [Armatimonadota bacterium]
MNLAEKVISTKRIYDGKILNLRVDTVILPDGREAKREIVEHRGAIAVVPLLDTTKVVMVKQYRRSAGEVLLEIPAGVMEKDEDAETSANRELMEEIGYKAGKLTRMYSTFLAPGYSEEMLHTFLAEDLVPARAKADDDEFIEIVTIELSDAVKMIRSGEIKDAKTASGLLMAQQMIGS